MPEAQTALFETGLWAIVRPFDVTVGVPLIIKALILDKLLRHRFGIILPVGSHVNGGTRFERKVNQIAKTLIDNTAFMVALLMPGIGKEQQDTIQRTGINHLLQDFDSIVLDETHIV